MTRLESHAPVVDRPDGLARENEEKPLCIYWYVVFTKLFFEKSKRNNKNRREQLAPEKPARESRKAAGPKAGAVQENALPPASPEKN